MALAATLNRTAMRPFAGPAVASRCSSFVAAPIAPVQRLTASSARVSTVVEVEAKLKTRKSAAKRLRVTGTGKLVARHGGKQHFNEKKSADALRKLGKMYVVAPGDVYNATKCLPNHSIGK